MSPFTTWAVKTVVNGRSHQSSRSLTTASLNPFGLEIDLESEAAVDVEVLSRDPDGAGRQQEHRSFCDIRRQTKSSKRNHSSSRFGWRAHRRHDFIADNVATRCLNPARSNRIDPDLVRRAKFLRKRLAVVVQRGFAGSIVY